MAMYQLIRANPDFRRAWLGMFISRLGDGLYSVAIIWITYQVTRSGFALGIVLGAFTFATFVFGILAGVLADRINRRTLMAGSSLLCGITVMLIPLASYGGILNLPLLTVLSFTLGALTQFFEPVVLASVPQLVEKRALTQANAALGTTESIGYFVGPPLGGVLISMFQTEVVLLLNGVSFILAALLIGRIQSPLEHAIQSAPLAKWTLELKEGLLFIKHNKTVLRLFFISAISLIAYSPFFVILPTFLDKALMLTSAAQATLLGILYSVLSLGQLIGFWLVGYLPDNIRVNVTIGYLLQAIGFGSIAALNDPVAIAIAVMLAGISFGLAGAPYYTALQRAVPNHLQGRVFGVRSTVTGLLAPTGRIIAGAALEYVSARTIFLLMGLLYLLNVLFASILQFNHPEEKLEVPQ